MKACRPTINMSGVAFTMQAKTKLHWR